MEQVIHFTNHVSVRCDQRAISDQMINDTIKFGCLIRKAGMKYYFMAEKCLDRISEKQYRDRVKNTVVIMSQDNVLLTAYKEPEALKKFKKQPKWAWRHRHKDKLR